MDKKTKMFFLVLILATAVSIILMFNRAFITKEYEVIQGGDGTSQI